MKYHVSLAKHQRLIPSFDPPAYPEEIRKVLAKRNSEPLVNGGAATWVASHLCHNSECYNPDHLVWEPSWMNRLRDNCPGGESCSHRPHRCIRAHRNKEEVILDWTKFCDDEQRAELNQGGGNGD